MTTAEPKALWPSAGRRYRVVALIGSTLFMQEYQNQAKRLSLRGQIPLSVHCYKSKDWSDPEITPEISQMLDDLKRQQIDMADEVLVINVGGYIGESTRSHLQYAQSEGKPVTFLEDPAERG